MLTSILPSHSSLLHKFLENAIIHKLSHVIDTQVLRKWQLWYVSRFQLSKFSCGKKILFGSYPGWNVNPNWDGKQYCEQHFPYFSFMRPFPDKLTLSEWIDPFSWANVVLLSQQVYCIYITGHHLLLKTWIKFEV